MLFVEAAPQFRRAESVALVPLPERAEILRTLPRTIPTVCCGSPDHIDRAFRAGASDFLCDPWTEEEFEARIGRLFRRAALAFPDIGATLEGTRLSGPAATVFLPQEEAALLRILYREAGKGVARAALRRLLWPKAPDRSRAVDEAVSRLRSRLEGAGISKSDIDIQPVRGFGYRLETRLPL